MVSLLLAETGPACVASNALSLLGKTTYYRLELSTDGTTVRRLNAGCSEHTCSKYVVAVDGERLCLGLQNLASDRVYDHSLGSTWLKKKVCAFPPLTLFFRTAFRCQYDRSTLQMNTCMMATGHYGPFWRSKWSDCPLSTAEISLTLSDSCSRRPIFFRCGKRFYDQQSLHWALQYREQLEHHRC
jgi:hypothetical protein